MCLHLPRTLISSLLQLPYPGCQPTHKLLRTSPLAAHPLQLLQSPPSNQELQNVCVIIGRVHSQALCHVGEVLEQSWVPPVVHQVSGHGDILPHHVGDGHHCSRGIQLEKLLDDLGVSVLVPLLV
uniref:Uncharacterized protein n=1 Tax=Fagus sylvatica TaxID=28930 RepID=A0A2N9GT26_FAGSY